MRSDTKAQQLSKFFIRETRRLDAAPDDWLDAVSLIVGGISYATGSSVTTICGYLAAAAGDGEIGPDRTALLLCEGIVDDGPTSTLTRLQDGATTASLPHVCSRLWAFARIAHCHGPAKLSLDVTSPSDEVTTIHEEEIAPQDDVIVWRCNLDGVVLSEPGRHLFSLEVDGVPVAMYWYTVVVFPAETIAQA